MRIFLILIALTYLLFSCASSEPIYDNSWPVERYLRVASQYSDKKQYSLSLKTYDQVFMRFSDKIAKVNIAEYEQGVVYYKMRKYKRALQSFETVINRFEDSLTANYFTKKDEWIRILAKKMIDKCDRKINHKKYAKEARAAKHKAKKEAYEKDRAQRRAQIEADQEMKAVKKSEKEAAKKAKAEEKAKAKAEKEAKEKAEKEAASKEEVKE